MILDFETLEVRESDELSLGCVAFGGHTIELSPETAKLLGRALFRRKRLPKEKALLHPIQRPYRTCLACGRRHNTGRRKSCSPACQYMVAAATRRMRR